VAWGTAVLDRKVFEADVMERFYGDAGSPDVQRLAVLFLTLAMGSLFDPMALPGAASELSFRHYMPESSLRSTDNVYSRDLFALGRACLSMDATASIICEHVVSMFVVNVKSLIPPSRPGPAFVH
jgi:hypothetical protein